MDKFSSPAHGAPSCDNCEGNDFFFFLPILLQNSINKILVPFILYFLRNASFALKTFLLTFPLFLSSLSPPSRLLSPFFTLRVLFLLLFSPNVGVYSGV